MHALWSVLYAFAFASFANAQGYLGGPQPNCLDSQPYKYIGCWDLTNIQPTLHDGYDLTITGHDFNQYPNNQEVYTYYAGPPGWSDPNSPVIFSYYDNSMNPKNCTTACRGHGYRFAGLSNNQCVCGAYPPSVAVDSPQSLDPLSSSSACHDFSITGGCQGDKSQQCGRQSIALVPPHFYADVYVDTSFPDPTTYDPALEKNNYQYYGCFHDGVFTNQGVSPANFRSTSYPFLGFSSILDCFQFCAASGFPFADLDSSNAYSGCQCSGEVQTGYQVADSFCNGNCLGAATCNGAFGGSGGSGCCGQGGNYHAFYLNPNLIGCYLPPAPGAFIDVFTTGPYAPPSFGSAVVIPVKATAVVFPGPAVVSTNPPSVPTNLAPYTDFVGCFRRNAGFPVVGIESYYYDSYLMTVDKCVSYCNSRGSLYASLIDQTSTTGFSCFCGEITDILATQIEISSCHMLCPGNTPPTKYEYCGGIDQFEEVFRAPSLPVVVPIESSQLGSNNVGCFEDNYGFPQLLANGAVLTVGTIEDCLGWCQLNGYPYAGLKTLPIGLPDWGGTSCLCSAALTDVFGGGALPILNCNLPCPGNLLENCGGWTDVLGNHAYVNVFYKEIVAPLILTTTASRRTITTSL